MNKKLMDFFNKQRENNDNENNILVKLKKKIKSIPPFTKLLIANISINGLGVLLFAFAIIAILGLPDAALNIMRSAVEDMHEGIRDIGEVIGNFITGYGFQTNEDLQEKYETRYYQRLRDVYDEYAYQEHHGHHNMYYAEVNTTLITATLFYERAGGDLSYDCSDNNANTDYCSSLDVGHEFSHNDVKFYKNAISKVELLARMMLVKNDIKYNCDNPKEKTTITPETIQELVVTPERDVSSIWDFFRSYKIPIRKFRFEVTENPAPEYPSYNECDMNKYSRLGKKEEGFQSDVDLIQQELQATEQYIKHSSLKSVFDSAKKELSSCTGDCSEFSNKITISESEMIPLENEMKALNIIGQFIDFDEEHNYRFKCPDNYAHSDPEGNPICQKVAPFDTPIYSSEWYQYGFYYYNLMNPLKEHDASSSFLERYYPNLVNDETREEDLLKIVEGIYSYYIEFIDNMGVYKGEYEHGDMLPTKFSGYSLVFNAGLNGTYGLIGAGPYSKWRQRDERWAHYLMHNETLGESGCAFTSVAILIAKAKEEHPSLDLSVAGAEFNPLSFLGVYKAAGGYRDSDSIDWDLHNVIPGFRNIGQGSSFEYAISHIAQGHYCVIHVNNEDINTFNHYVAAAGVVNGEIYVYDPGRRHDGAVPITSLYSHPVRTDQVICYEVVE